MLAQGEERTLGKATPPPHVQSPEGGISPSGVRDLRLYAGILPPERYPGLGAPGWNQACRLPHATPLGRHNRLAFVKAAVSELFAADAEHGHNLVGSAEAVNLGASDRLSLIEALRRNGVSCSDLPKLVASR
jgi:hypothetical protein